MELQYTVPARLSLTFHNPPPSFSIEVVPHRCDAACECRKDLDAALAALKASTRLLEAFILTESLELIEKHHAGVRAAHIRLTGAIAAFRDHTMEAM